MDQVFLSVLDNVRLVLVSIAVSVVFVSMLVSSLFAVSFIIRLLRGDG